MTTILKSKTNSNTDDAENVGAISVDTMFFEKRRSVFFNLKGKKPYGYNVHYSNVIPHYLMYSVLGRAGLIEFESFRNV